MHAYGWRFDFENGLLHSKTIWNSMHGDLWYSLHNHMTFFYTIMSYYDRCNRRDFLQCCSSPAQANSINGDIAGSIAYRHFVNFWLVEAANKYQSQRTSTCNHTEGDGFQRLCILYDEFESQIDGRIVRTKWWSYDHWQQYSWNPELGYSSPLVSTLQLTAFITTLNHGLGKQGIIALPSNASSTCPILLQIVDKIY